MAGGIGSRFWPMSRTEMPKQFLDILGTGETLIQMTYKRLRKVCPEGQILVVTNEMYRGLVLEQLPEMKEGDVLCEPCRRNTAPCIAYAAYKIQTMNKRGKMIVAPSDHLITDTQEFVRIIDLALQKAGDDTTLVTLGITPSRPDTGYGYIRFSEEQADFSDEVRRVLNFTEKPDHNMAEKFLNSGDYAWNSGIFIWTVKSFVEELNKQLPDVSELFESNLAAYGTYDEQNFINEIYPKCQDISVDYGIMENAGKVWMVQADFGWSDLGTWGSLYTHLGHDDKGNATVGKEVMMHDSSNCIVHIEGDRLAVVQGLDDYIVVNTEKALLIVKKQDEQKIKQFVNELKKKGKKGYY